MLSGKTLSFFEVRKSRLFCKIFFSYFIIIIIPVMVASIINYFYVVRIIEKEVEKSSTITVSNYVRSTDSFFDSLNGNMLDILTSPPVERLLIGRNRINNRENANKNMMILDATRDLNVLIKNLVDSSDMIHNAYVYFVDGNRVLDEETAYDAPYFFRYINRYDAITQDNLDKIFSRNHMMFFLPTQKVSEIQYLTNHVTTSNYCISVITSYPFHTKPKAYMVVNIKEENLREMLTIKDYEHIQNFILDRDNHLISYSGNYHADLMLVNKVIGDRDKGASTVKIGIKWYKMLFVRSDLNNWRYISLVDLDELRKPADYIKSLALWFFALFSSIGLVISYKLGYRMYYPIKELRVGFERVGDLKGSIDNYQEQNEFDLIKMWSTLILNRNKRMMREINEMRPVVQENFVNRLLNREIQDTKPIIEYARKIGLKINDKGNKAVICVEIQYYPNTSEDLLESEKKLLIMELKNKIQHSMEKNVWFTEVKKNILACIIQYDELYRRDHLLQDAHMIKGILEEYRGYYKATIGVGNLVEHTEDIHQSYFTALEMLDYKSLSGDIEIIDEEMIEERINQEGYLSSEDVYKIINNVRLGNKEGLMEVINGILHACREHRTPAGQVISISRDILNVLVRELKIHNRNDYGLEKYSVLMARINSCVIYDNIIECFDEICNTFLDINEVKDDKEQIFLEVTSYIQKNFHKDISLEYFANKYSMSLGYFSRSFKEIVGEKYSDYVNKCRIDNAKRLLISTEKKIEDISYEVGYVGKNSFNTIFKKYEGITPGKYRSLYKKGKI